MEFSAEMIAGFLGGEVMGDRSAKVWTIAKIEEGEAGALSFLSNLKYEPYLYDTASSVVIVSRTFKPARPVKATLVAVEDPYASFAKLLALYVANKPQKKGIRPLASIHPSAQLGEGCYVGEYAVIDEGVTVGEGCRLFPHVYVGDRVRIGKNVTLHAGVCVYEDCVIGDNVIIHAGAVIGSDGFGFAPNEQGEFSKIPQIGNVVIEDDVEIGSNTCIDRATMGSTVIKKGVKLDNLIQIGHNVVVGENTICAAQVGIAGSTKVGGNVMMGGQVGIVGHIQIGDRVQIGSKAGIAKNIADGETFMGYPALPYSKFQRVNAVYRNLPDLSARVHQLEKMMKQTDHETTD